MTALIRNYLPNNFSWDNWRGSFDEVKDYLLDAYSKALSEFAKSVSNQYLRKELVEVVEQLCYPMPEERGHPKDLVSRNQFNLERYVTKLAVLHKKAEYNLIN